MIHKNILAFIGIPTSNIPPPGGAVKRVVNAGVGVSARVGPWPSVCRKRRRGLMQGSYERQFFKCYLRKTGKKVDNQLKMIQKGLLLSCSYSRSVKLLPEATHDKCPSRCLNLSVNLFNDIGDIRFALHPRSSRLDKKQFLQHIFFADEFSFVIISSA